MKNRLVFGVCLQNNIPYLLACWVFGGKVKIKIRAGMFVVKRNILKNLCSDCLQSSNIFLNIVVSKRKK